MFLRPECSSNRKSIEAKILSEQPVVYAIHEKMSNSSNIFCIKGSEDFSIFVAKDLFISGKKIASQIWDRQPRKRALVSKVWVDFCFANFANLHFLFLVCSSHLCKLLYNSTQYTNYRWYLSTVRIKPMISDYRPYAVYPWLYEPIG